MHETLNAWNSYVVLLVNDIDISRQAHSLAGLHVITDFQIKFYQKSNRQVCLEKVYKASKKKKRSFHFLFSFSLLFYFIINIYIQHVL